MHRNRFASFYTISWRLPDAELSRMDQYEPKPLPGQKWIIAAMVVVFCAIVTFLVVSKTATTEPVGDGQVRYVAEAGAKPFHKPHCDFARNIPAANLEEFQTRDAAIRAGHRACHICRP